MQVARKFKMAINRTFNEEQGVFWKGLTDEQIATFTMKKVQEFVKRGGKALKASFLIGRQRVPILNGEQSEEAGNELDEDGYDSGIYILNEKTQVNLKFMTNKRLYSLNLFSGRKLILLQHLNACRWRYRQK